MYNDYSNRKDAIWLQSHGWQHAIPAKELKVGMVTVWNSGCTEKIISITLPPKGKKMIKTIIEAEGDGNLYNRNFKPDRLIAVQEATQ